MTTRTMWILVFVLAAIIVVLATMLFLVPGQAQAPIVATSTQSTSTGQTPPSGSTPLSSRVSVTTPLPGAVVGHSVPVSGKAPGNWFFEASFPIQVRDLNGNIVGRAVAQAQSDWMTTNLVPFAATVVIDAGFTGPATLILLRDNPSGLPENDDSVEFAITVS